jgi:cytidine deaminase
MNMNKPILDAATKQKLIDASLQARKRAYAPYSHYYVGAALLTESGKIFEGLNIENASYGATVCAERVAVFNAVSSGEKNFIAMSVVGEQGGPPCGLCRQVLAEFGLDIVLLLVNKDGELVGETTVGDVLPGAFTPDKLGVDPSSE